MRQALVAALIALAAFAVNAYAQQTPVTVIGAVTAGNCASFNSNTVIKDAGTTCGGGAASSGTVLSVGLTVQPPLQVSGSPITTSGTFVTTWQNQPANWHFAGPVSGSSNTPAFRPITSADLPVINLASTTTGGVTGILPTTNGGTGIANPPAFSLLVTSSSAANPFTTIPAATGGRLVIDQGAGIEWAAKAMTGDASITSTGALTVSASGGSAFGTFAFQNFATPPTIGGVTPGIVNTSQLQINGNVMTMPAAPDTICGVGTNCVWQNVNKFLRVRVQTLVITSGATSGVPYNVNSGSDYLICLFKTTGSASSVNLPSSPTQGDTYVIKDCKGDDATNAITVNSAAGSNTDNIEGAAAPFTMNASTATFRDRNAFTWSGNATMGWILN